MKHDKPGVSVRDRVELAIGQVAGMKYPMQGIQHVDDVSLRAHLALHDDDLDRLAIDLSAEFVVEIIPSEIPVAGTLGDVIRLVESKLAERTTDAADLSRSE